MSIVSLGPRIESGPGEPENPQHSQLVFNEEENKYYLQLTQESYRDLLHIINPYAYEYLGAQGNTKDQGAERPITEFSVDKYDGNDKIATISLSVQTPPQTKQDLMEDLRSDPPTFVTNPLSYNLDKGSQEKPNIQVSVSSLNSQKEPVEETLTLLPNTLLIFDRVNLQEPELPRKEISFRPTHGKDEALGPLRDSPEAMQNALTNLDEFLARAASLLEW